MMTRVLVSFIAALLVAGTAARAQDDDTLRIVMVTHGAAGVGFWAKVKEGADAAAEATGVELVYRAPESFDLDRMAELVNEAAAEAPDGLIVSIPNADALAGPIRTAVDAGIPVISINSGFDVGRSLGALLHVGQSEYEAGRVAGEAMRDSAGTHALCLNHELGNVALDLRCKGFIDGFAGSVEVMPVSVEPEETLSAIAERLESEDRIDVILALSATSAGEPAIAAVKALEEGRTVNVGTFDVTDTVLAEVAAGAASFAVDQQPFLQGYFPVQFLVVLNRRGVVPVANVSTGPRLIDAEQARRLLDMTGAEAEPAGEAAESN